MHNAYLLGRHLRQQLQLTENMPWPPEPELRSNEYAASIIPTIIFNLMSWIVTRGSDYCNVLIMFLLSLILLHCTYHYLGYKS